MLVMQTMDSDLNFNSHIKTITKSAYYHLTNNIVLEKLIHTFIFSRLDFNDVSLIKTASTHPECCN